MSLIILISLIFGVALQTVAAESTVKPQEKCGDNTAAQKPIGDIEPVACFYGAMLTGVTVSQDGRIFVNFPKWGDRVEYTVAEVVDGKTKAYPNAEMNNFNKDKPAEALASVQSVVVDPKNRLWALDTGRIEWGPPLGPKLVGIDLGTNKVFKTISFPGDVCLPDSYLMM